MKKAYDREKAVQLVPLLRSIVHELVERTQAIETLEASLAETSPPNAKRRQAAREVFHVQADLAHQRRDLRLAKQELARLGCEIDPDHPLRVLIPGEHGEVEDGYIWALDDAEPTPVSVVSTG